MKFIDKKGREITLNVDESEMAIDAWHESILIGSIRFNLIEEVDCEYLLVTNMHLDQTEGYLRAGIGTEIINLAEQEFACSVAFATDDGNKRDDGSHLTGDGPAFANSFSKSN